MTLWGCSPDGGGTAAACHEADCDHAGEESELAHRVTIRSQLLDVAESGLGLNGVFRLARQSGSEATTASLRAGGGEGVVPAMSRTGDSGIPLYASTGARAPG